jgi:phosphoribulokinase
MSRRHPVVAITGSSGAGTTTVTRTFEHIFRREGINAAVVEGDSFHRYDRAQMKAKLAEAAAVGNQHFSHFGPEANLFDELEALFRSYGETGTGRLRKYLHNARKRRRTASRRARSRRGRTCRRTPICFSTRACTARSPPTGSTWRRWPTS